MTNKNTDKTTNSALPSWVIGILPLVLLVAVIFVFQAIDPLSVFTEEVPPIEELELRRMVLDDDGFQLEVMNSGPDPIVIAQVLVDEAYWHYSFDAGDNELDRLETAKLRVPYPWVEGEAHEIVVLTNSGATFPFEVEVALPTPEATSEKFQAYGLLGFYIGVVPVILGLLWYPLLRNLEQRWLDFILSLTVGLLVFLAVDTVLEALELAAEVPGVFNAEPLVFLLTFISLLAIMTASKVFNTGGVPLFLSYTIALGIGLHNLGEGLAVGAAFAVGQVSLGTFLVVGFTLHNITEGIGIAAPIAQKRPALHHFGLLALLAGGPAILGTWIGGFTFDPFVAVIFLSIGAGAILQVVYEVSQLVIRHAEADADSETSFTTLNLAGLFLGIAIMYSTAFLVA